MTRFTRRGLLKASATAGAALMPFFPILESDAETTGFPKRMILFYMPTGTYLPNWRPQGTVTDFTLGSILEPLEVYKQKLLILDGIDNTAVTLGVAPPGHPGISSLWTGTPHGEGTFSPNGSESFGWPTGPSVDQYLAARIAETEAYPFRSIELGAQCSTSVEPWAIKMSFQGKDQPIPHEDDPVAAFDRLFGDAIGDPDVLKKIRIARLSVIDRVNADLQGLRARIPTADRAKLDAHLENLSTIEARLNTPSNCEELPTGPGNNLDTPALVKTQIDLVVAALKCGLTRVASLFMGREVSGLGRHQWLGHTDNSHQISHLNTADGHQRMTEIGNWYAQQFKYLLDALEAVPEGDGTMLDNTVVVWASPVGNSWGHTPRNIPVVLAGSCGGYFKTGQHLQWGSYDITTADRKDHGGKPMNDVLISLCHAMGLEDVETFGAPSLCTGPISELV